MIDILWIPLITIVSFAVGYILGLVFVDYLLTRNIINKCNEIIEEQEMLE